VYTLAELDSTTEWEPEAVRAVISEVAACVLFWHCKARMTNGNIVSGCPISIVSEWC
jgi:hypothetical protein